MTDLYAVIGNPIVQSKSPLIHAAFALATGQDLRYSKLLGQLGEFAADADVFRASGGRGMNVTMPFKLDAFAYATDLSERARKAGAVNALKFQGGKVYGENFDGVGLVNDIAHNLGHALTGKRVLLLGAGGAARGAVWPILQEQPAHLVIANRTVDKAQAIIADHPESYVLSASGYAQLQNPQAQPFDVVINATSTGLQDDAPPIAASVFATGSLAYEMVYGKGLTGFLRLAKTTGHTQLADGVGMLIEQAAEAFYWWRGVRPLTATMIKSMTVNLV